MTTLNVNQKIYQVDVDPNMPLLWVIRDIIGLTGTKYGCGVAQCGACVVHLNGEAVRSCVTKVSRAEGQKIVTIEGLSANNDHPHSWPGRRLMCRNVAIVIPTADVGGGFTSENPNPTDRILTSLCREIFVIAEPI
jgi:isoquinoline 1-oxidoreductase alpha subunit